MIEPTIANFHKAFDGTDKTVIYCSGPVSLHPNPRLYKHYWQIFTPDCGWEDDAFFDNAPILCAFDFQQRLAALSAAGKSCMVYGFTRPRNDPRNPWDMNHPKWKDQEFAPGWDEDPAPVIECGHK